jgi:hypothetical protein
MASKAEPDPVMETYTQKKSRKPIFFITAIAAVVLFFAYSWLFKSSETVIVQKVRSFELATFHCG